MEPTIRLAKDIAERLGNLTGVVAVALGGSVGPPPQARARARGINGTSRVQERLMIAALKTRNVMGTNEGREKLPEERSD